MITFLLLFFATLLHADDMSWSDVGHAITASGSDDADSGDDDGGGDDDGD